MRLSAREQTGLRTMIALARSYGQGPIALTRIAQQEELPLAYLEQIARHLRRAGLLGSARGARGGYFLLRNPAEISVSEILSALEGQLVSLDCLSEHPAACGRASACEARGVWLRVQDCLQHTLDAMTLADVL